MAKDTNVKKKKKGKKGKHDTHTEATSRLQRPKKNFFSLCGSSLNERETTHRERLEKKKSDEKRDTKHQCNGANQRERAAATKPSHLSPTTHKKKTPKISQPRWPVLPESLEWTTRLLLRSDHPHTKQQQKKSDCL